MMRDALCAIGAWFATGWFLVDALMASVKGNRRKMWLALCLSAIGLAVGYAAASSLNARVSP